MRVNAPLCCCHSAFFSAGADYHARFATLGALVTSGLAWAKTASCVSRREARSVMSGFMAVLLSQVMP